MARLVSLAASLVAGSVERKLGEDKGKEGRPDIPEAPPKFITLAEFAPFVPGNPAGRPVGNCCAFELAVDNNTEALITIANERLNKPKTISNFMNIA
jgi:hypothetical protein